MLSDYASQERAQLCQNHYTTFTSDILQDINCSENVHKKFLFLVSYQALAVLLMYQPTVTYVTTPTSNTLLEQIISYVESTSKTDAGLYVVTPPPTHICHILQNNTTCGTTVSINYFKNRLFNAKLILLVISK
jgi:hypothetical protein